MSNLLKHIDELLALDPVTRKPAEDLMMKILTNIQNEPNVAKYQDLNFSKIRKKFQPCPPCLYLLFCAGFNQSVDGSRLQFNMQNWKMLEHTKKVLDVRLYGPTPEQIAEKKRKEEEEEKEKMQLEQEKEKENKPEQDPADKVSDEVLKEMGLDPDEMDLLQQIKSNKTTSVSLSMAELQGLTREEKIALFKKKQQDYRKEKAQNQSKGNIAREKNRRENIKAMQEVDRKRKEYEQRMMANRKKREKKDAVERKKRVRERIAADKARKQKEKEISERIKQQELAAQQQQQQQQ